MTSGAVTNWPPLLNWSVDEIRQDLEVRVQQPSMRDDVLTLLDAIAGSERVDLHSLAAEYRLRLDRIGRPASRPTSRLRQMDDDLMSAQGVRDYRYADLLSELFAPAHDGGGEALRLRSRELERLICFADAAQSETERIIAKDLLLRLRRCDCPQVEQALAGLVQTTARRALDAGMPKAARQALLEIPPEQVDPALLNAIETVEQAYDRLDGLMESARELVIADWQDLAASETIREQLNDFYSKHSDAFPALGPCIDRLRDEQDAFLLVQARSCLDLSQVSQLLDRLQGVSSPAWLDRLSPDWFESARIACRQAYDKAMDTADSPAQLAEALPSTLPPGLKRLIPELAGLKTGIDGWVRDWNAAESGQCIDLAGRGDPPGGLRRRLDDLAAKRALIAGLTRLQCQPEPSQVEAVRQLRSDPALRSEVELALEQVEERMRRQQTESFLVRLDIPPPPVAALDERLRQAILHLAQLRDAQPFDRHETALVWWRQWRALAPVLEAPRLEYPAFDHLLHTLRQERLRQWRSILEECLYNEEHPCPNPLAITHDLREAEVETFKDLAESFECLGLERAVHDHLGQGTFSDADQALAQLKRAGIAAARLDDLTLQIEIGRSRLGGDGASTLQQLWLTRSADIIRALPDAAPGILLDAFDAAWRAGDHPVLRQLADTMIPGGNDASVIGRLHFWRSFAVSAPSLLADPPSAVDFEHLASALFSDLPASHRQTASAPLTWLAAQWQNHNNLTALAWCALVLATDWPELRPLCADAPRHLIDGIEAEVTTTMAEISGLSDLQPDRITPVLERSAALAAKWRHWLDCLRRATVVVPIPPPPGNLLKLTDTADRLRRTAADFDVMLNADFRDPATPKRWVSLRASLVALQSDLGGAAFGQALVAVHGLEGLFSLRNHFARFVSTCTEIVSPDGLDTDDRIEQVDGLLVKMAATLNPCQMQDSPGAVLLWADCAETLIRIDPGIAALIRGRNADALRAAIAALLAECGDMRRTIRTMMDALPLTVVDDPAHMSALVAAFPKTLPPRARPRLLLRQFCRHDIMPGLLARHPLHFPNWVGFLE